MKNTFVLFASPAYEARLAVCIDSLVEHMPSFGIDVNFVEDPAPGQPYVSGIYKKYYQRVLDLLMEGHDNVILIGTDTVLYAGLPLAFSNVDEYRVVMTPHVIKPPARNGDFYATGHAQGGIVKFSQRGIPVLTWILSQELDRDVRSQGLFYDQSVLSSLPFLFDDIRIYRQPDMNLAWFNHKERDLTWEHQEERFRTRGMLLRMAHFSGFIPGSPERISKHYSGPPAEGAYLKLLKDYDRRLKEAGQV